MPRQIYDQDFDRAIRLANAAGDLISKAVNANIPAVQNAVNDLVQDMTAYAVELLGKPSESTETPAAKTEDAPLTE